MTVNRSLVLKGHISNNMPNHFGVSEELYSWDCLGTVPLLGLGLEKSSVISRTAVEPSK